MAAAAENLVLTHPGSNRSSRLRSDATSLLGVGAAIVLAVMVAVWMWSQQPEYRVLFANFTDRDGGAITASLDQMAVKYKFSEGGGAILVPANQVHDVRLKLAAQGLPKGGNVGFELMENQKLGVSQFLEQVNYQRSLEGELARSIQSLAAVSAARVHLALPKPSVFVRDAAKADRLGAAQPADRPHHRRRPGQRDRPPGRLQRAGTAAVERHRGRPGRQPAVGHLGKPPGAKNLDPNQLKYVHAAPAGHRQAGRVADHPAGRPGQRARRSDRRRRFRAGRHRRRNLQAEFAAGRLGDPQPAVVRSRRRRAPTASGVPGALSNQPPGAATAPITAGGAGRRGAAAAAPARRRKDSTTNYEVDKTVRYEQQPMGGVKRLSVGVVVNYRRLVDPKTGKVTIKALDRGRSGADQ